MMRMRVPAPSSPPAATAAGVSAADMQGLVRSLRRFLGRTPVRTFVVYPVLVLGVETLRRKRLQVPAPGYLPLLAWGYLQYRLTGDYRRRQQAGEPGFDKPPDRLLQTGPYAYTRNPMYLGHLIFLLGLALSFRSPLGWLLWLVNIPWFHYRVLYDETRLREKFCAEYADYCARVRRWLPFVL
jgi:protein-S-isoprenylcysteine O-methyltransferase Ste14